jgi:putative acetyltransferase
MSAGAFPKPSLRPYLDSDLPSLSEIRFAAIEELTGEDYDETQRQAWASLADDDQAFAETLEKGLTLVAQIGGEPVGFITLHDDGVIDQLYVHPAVARTGVATALCEAIERQAAAHGIAILVADVSDTAKTLFEARGYRVDRRQTIEIDGQWLGNTRMKKVLSPKSTQDWRQ